MRIERGDSQLDMTSSDVPTKMGDTHFMLFHRGYHEKPEDSGDTIFSDKAIWVCLKMMDTKWHL